MQPVRLNVSMRATRFATVGGSLTKVTAISSPESTVGADDYVLSSSSQRLALYAMPYFTPNTRNISDIACCVSIRSYRK